MTKEILNQIQILNSSFVLFERSQSLFSHKELAGKILTSIESSKIPGRNFDRSTIYHVEQNPIFVSVIEDPFLKTYQENISETPKTDLPFLFTGRIFLGNR
ncbi:hypothetical protein DLM75_16265 [Leptospira stimsonii]|uniref:Uncharacterized protein n=1 Tax=Leptospira stimsonii TaxID=2202203 RepID=A0A396Z5G6_9LEPT|nr:hypothetical protein DLM75_16265 [Leptospira stimsonii]